MMARVRGVRAASMAAGSMLNVSASMSTKTGVPPALWMVPAVAKNVNGVVMTSSPGFRSRALRGRSSASVPLAHPMPYFACERAATSTSSFPMAGPMMNCWASITSWTAASVSFFMVWYWATRSSIGTFTRFSRGSKWRLGIAEGPARLGILGATRGAPGDTPRYGQALTALAHPAHAPGRYAHHQAVGRHIRRHHGARADEGVLAEGGAADDRGVRADRGAPPHPGLPVLVLPGHVAPRVEHVGEHARRPAEHIVLEVHAFVDRHVVLDLHVVADRGARHHHDVLAEARALADHRALHHVTEMPDLGAGADDGAFVEEAGRVDVEVRHQPMTRTSGSSSTPVFFCTVFRTCSISFCTSAAVAVPRLTK